MVTSYLVEVERKWVKSVRLHLLFDEVKKIPFKIHERTQLKGQSVHKTISRA